MVATPLARTIGVDSPTTVLTLEITHEKASNVVHSYSKCSVIEIAVSGFDMVRVFGKIGFMVTRQKGSHILMSRGEETPVSYFFYKRMINEVFRKYECMGALSSGDCSRELAKYPEVQQAFCEVIRRDPGNQWAWYNLANGSDRRPEIIPGTPST